MTKQEEEKEAEEKVKKTITTKFGNFLQIIIRSTFGIDWYSGFGSGEVQSLPSPMGTKTCPLIPHAALSDLQAIITGCSLQRICYTSFLIGAESLLLLSTLKNFTVHKSS